MCFKKEIIKNLKKYYDTKKLSINLLGNERVKRLLMTEVKLISFSLFLLNHRIFLSRYTLFLAVHIFYPDFAVCNPLACILLLFF